MFPFWEVAVAPVLEAAGARRIVEVGALRGENTRQMIERLGPRTELHVIDPLPDFDPAEHEREFGGQYTFHRALSVDVLGSLAPMDAALIDGDHNWYTVVTELRLLRQVAREGDAPLPVLLLHDVGWPYGRRDLYYDPLTIPDEHRKEWKRAGMEPDKVRLVPFGAGLNPTLANAKVEGGRHNGVRTALDDFVAEHDRPLRVVVLPIYFGLAIVAEEERLARQPALAGELDRLESPAGKDQLLGLAEDIRLRSLMFQHKIFYDREESVARVARRYLGELRCGVLAGAAPSGVLDRIEAGMDAAQADLAPGDVVSLDPARPGPASFLGAYLDAHGPSRRRLWVASAAGAAALGPTWDRLGLDLGRVQVLEAAGVPEEVAFVHVGAGAQASTVGPVLDRLSHGGRVVAEADLDDQVRIEVQAATRERGLVEVDPDDAQGVSTWRRPTGAVPSAAAADGVAGA